MSASNGAIASSHRPRVSTLEGVVEAVNERGVRLGGEWHNLSKFRPLELPLVGSTVRLAVDPKGFLNAIDVLELSPAGDSQNLPVGNSRDRQIARLTVLKAAANFAATRADIRSSDVLRIADSWLAWVEQQT